MERVYVTNNQQVKAGQPLFSIRKSPRDRKLERSAVLVRAPSAGEVVGLFVRPGSYVQEGVGQLILVVNDSWWIQANIKENNLSRIKVGQPVLVSLAMYPGEIFKAKVIGIGGGVSSSQAAVGGEFPYIKKTHNWVRLSQRFPVALAFTDLPKGYPLRIGASADVTILTTTNGFWRFSAMVWQWLCSELAYLS